MRPRHDGIPNGVSLPYPLNEESLVWPGQNAGFLGTSHDPWQLNADPNDPDFYVRGLSLREELNVGRLENSRQLLEQFNRQQEWM